jgi:hypothetical protein
VVEVVVLKLLGLARVMRAYTGAYPSTQQSCRRVLRGIEPTPSRRSERSLTKEKDNNRSGFVNSCNRAITGCREHTWGLWIAVVATICIPKLQLLKQASKVGSLGKPVNPFK